MAEKAESVWRPFPEQAVSKGWWSGWGWVILPSVLGVAFVIIALTALQFINVALQSQVISLMISAVTSDIWVFFLFFFVMSSLDHLTKSPAVGFSALRPLSTAVAITFAVWTLSWVFRTIGPFSDTALFIGSILARANLVEIFFIFLILGYILHFAARKIRFKTGMPPLPSA